MLTSIHLAPARDFKYHSRRALGDRLTFAHDVGATADSQGLAHVVVGDQRPYVLVGELSDDGLDVHDRIRFHAGERLVEQYETRLGGEGPRNFQSAPLAA